MTVKSFLLSWGLIILSALFDSYAAFVVKWKFNQLGPFDTSSTGSVLNYLGKFIQSPLLATAVVTFCLAPGLWFFALNRVQLSVGYPTLVGFHLIFILIFGLLFLGEPLTQTKTVGLALIFLSLFFLFKS